MRDKWIYFVLGGSFISLNINIFFSNMSIFHVIAFTGYGFVILFILARLVTDEREMREERNRREQDYCYVHGPPHDRHLCTPCRQSKREEARRYKFENQAVSETPLPTVELDEPLRGWKIAKIAAYGYENEAGETKFAGATWRSDIYGLESYASCSRGATHSPPQETCTCGFYVMRERDSLLSEMSEPRSHVLLEVELAGRVIEGTYGYRGEWQRVLTVHVPSYKAATGWDAVRLQGLLTVDVKPLKLTAEEAKALPEAQAYILDSTSLIHRGYTFRDAEGNEITEFPQARFYPDGRQPF